MTISQIGIRTPSDLGNQIGFEYSTSTGIELYAYAVMGGEGYIVSWALDSVGMETFYRADTMATVEAWLEGNYIN